MPILKNQDGTLNITKCKWYCINKDFLKLCWENCRNNSKRKEIELKLNQKLITQKILDEIEKTLY